MKSISPWVISFDQFEPEKERLRESLCALGNGFFCTRGAFNETYVCSVHYPGTYLAAGYNRVATKISGKKIYNEDLVNFPNWLYLTFIVAEGKKFSPLVQKILSFRQELDLKQGVLRRKIKVQDAEGRQTFIESQRIVSMDNPHYGAIKYNIIPENYSDWITIKSSLDGSVRNAGVERYKTLNNLHLKSQAIKVPFKDIISLSAKTSQSNITIAMASKLKVLLNHKEIKPVMRSFSESGKIIGQECSFFVNKKKMLTVEKTVSIHACKAKSQHELAKIAVMSVRKTKSFYDLFTAHKKAWSNLWKRFDIQISGDIFAQQVTRFHMFHLLQTASPHNQNIDAGFPARGLTGEAYRGHIFWDEIYAVHFYDTHYPEISKSLLSYRFKRIEKARKYAKEHSFQGAMFPWQSGSSGVEETQVIHLNPMSGRWGPDHSSNQRHVSFAIAYNTWQYWNKTGDLDFLNNQGAEIILSVAKFASSLLSFSTKDKKYHTQGLMGPDEFHEKLPNAKNYGLKDNAYSNFMISWILDKAKEIIDIIDSNIKKKLLKKYIIDQDVIIRWQHMSENIHIIINKDGVISQFDGYFKLKELNWSHYRKKYNNIHRMDRILKSENKSPDAFKLSKQADVLMIFYLFHIDEVKKRFKIMGYKLKNDCLKTNYEYYVKRTSHGSTLSKVVHCYLAFVLKKNKEAWNWYYEVLQSDICDTQGGTTPEGIHCGVMGGSVDLIIRAFAGIEINEDKIIINPSIPPFINEIKFKMLIRGIWVHFSFSKRIIEIQLKDKGKKSLDFAIENSMYTLKSSKTYEFILKKTRN